MTHHFIILDLADQREADYGIMFHSRNVFRGRSDADGPVRLKFWDNRERFNPDRGKQLGEPIRGGNLLTKYSPPGTADRKYIDPNGKPTDEPFTLLLSPECAVITSNGTNTGTAASGQVYAAGGNRLADGDTATISYPNGTLGEIEIHFPPHHNGHGFATLR